MTDETIGILGVVKIEVYELRSLHDYHTIPLVRKRGAIAIKAVTGVQLYMTTVCGDIYGVN